MSRTSKVVCYLLLALTASFCFYLRFPTYVHHPNFYAEDARYADRAMKESFWIYVRGRFNGRYIVGSYLLTRAGFFLNALMTGGDFLNLPIAFALVSYLFLGFVAALPWFLLRAHLKTPALLTLVFMNTFVPLIYLDYAIIGTLANLKFCFSYLAFLLVIYRFSLPSDSLKFYLVDLLIVLCGLTNMLTYLLAVPVFFKALMGKHHERYSAIALGTLLLIPLLVIFWKGGTEIDGLSNVSFDKRRLIEVLFARTFLFGNFFWLFEWLTDARAIALVILIATVCWHFWGRTQRGLYLAAFGAPLFCSLLVIMHRPGVHRSFHGYLLEQDAEQYFFSQNCMFYVAIALLFQAGIDSFRLQWIRKTAWAVVVAFCLVCAPFSGSFGRNFPFAALGTIDENVKKACEQPGDPVVLQTYPATESTMGVTRSLVCREKGTKLLSGNRLH